MKTVVLMSRGLRLGPLYAEIARNLSADHRVIAVIDETERPIWEGLAGVEAYTLHDLAAGEAWPSAEEMPSAVERIEAETGLRAYQAARNYLLYGRLHSELFGWREKRWLWQDEAAIQTDYVRAYLALDRIFRSYAPSLVLLEAPDHIYASIAQAMAYQRNVLCLGLYFAPLAGSCSMFLYTGFQPHNVMMRYFYDHPEEIPKAAHVKAREMIVSVRQAGPPAIEYVSNMSARSKEIFGPLLRKAVTGLMTPEGRERWAPRAVRRRSRTLKNELWLRDHLRSDIPAGKYALYFMQHQPEASVATQAPHMVDQARLIEQLAVNAPAGWRIVVKEHPRTYPTRGRDFYRPLIDLPNVHLCQPSVSSRSLLEGASVVVALTGSVGMEALFAGKRVAVVGRPYYSFFPGVIKLDRPGELFDVIDTVEPAAADDPLLLRFAAAYYASVFDLGTLSEDRMWPRPDEGGASLAAAVRRHLALIDRGVLAAATYPIRQR